MSKHITGNPERDFFEQNPEFQYVQLGFLVKKEQKDDASKIMWALFLSEDPESKLFRIPVEERRSNIAEMYLKDPNFDWTSIQQYIDMYPMSILTKEQIMYKIWADKLDELTTHLRKLDITKEDAKVIKIMEKMEKIWTSYEKVRTKMVETKNKSQLHGGATESKRESRGSRKS